MVKMDGSTRCSMSANNRTADGSGKRGGTASASLADFPISRARSSDADLTTQLDELERIGSIKPSKKIQGQLRRRVLEAVCIARALRAQRDIAVGALDVLIGARR